MAEVTGVNQALIEVESCKIRAVVVEIKYITVQNITVHTENCKIELQLDVSIYSYHVWYRGIKQMQRICRFLYRSVSY